jgi:hypothetical protein
MRLGQCSASVGRCRGPSRRHADACVLSPVRPLASLTSCAVVSKSTMAQLKSHYSHKPHGKHARVFVSTSSLVQKLQVFCASLGQKAIFCTPILLCIHLRRLKSDRAARQGNLSCDSVWGLVEARGGRAFAQGADEGLGRYGWLADWRLW